MKKSLLVRKLWTEVNFEAQLSAARKIEQAVHAVDPEGPGRPDEFGRMQPLAYRGANCPVCFAPCREKHRPLTRPAGGSYSDGLHETVIEYHQLPALSYHAAGGEAVHCVSEIENWPCTLRTNKSMRRPCCKCSCTRCWVLTT